MGLVLLATRLLLAVVFAVAGLAKLADMPGARKALGDFGVPEALAAPLGVLRPLAELAVALALLPAASAWWGALGLLGLFCGGIGWNLARGRHPDCHCFGQVHSAPVGWRTLGRNGGLAAVAGLVLWQGAADPGPGALDWLGASSMIEVALLIGGLVALALLAAEGWLLLQLVAQNGRLLLKLEELEERLAAGGVAAAHAPPMAEASAAAGLPVGAPAPEFALAGLHGETLTLGALRAAGKPVLLAFTDPQCGPCGALVPELGRWQREHASSLSLAVLSRGTAEQNRAKAAEHGLGQVLLQRDREVAEAYQAHGTPSAVLVRADGTVGSPLAAGADAMRALVARAGGAAAALPLVTAPLVAPAAPNGHVAPNGKCPNCGQVHAPNGNGVQAAAAPAANLGQPAPALRLPDLEGRTVDLADFRGNKTLLLFWNPGCGFCERMLPELKQWEAAPPPDAPKLVVVSTGTAEANRALGLRSPLLLADEAAPGAHFGANGTPMAVLIDAEGRVASAVGSGAPGVWPLLGGAPKPASA